MPIRKMPGPKGGYRATYGGVTRNFKTRAAAEKWSALKNINKKAQKTSKKYMHGMPRRAKP